MASKGQRGLLLTIPVSHYCEKARWALDRAGITYEERRYVQILHYLPTLWHARSIFAPAFRVNNAVYTTSTAIVEFADAELPDEHRLFPTAPAEREAVQQWVARFDAAVGIEARRWMYLLVFQHLSPARAVLMAAQGVALWQRIVTRLVFPLAVFYLRRRLDVTPTTVAAGLERLEQSFEQVSRELSDGRRYLVGERFSAADLTFAALSAVILLPAQYPVKLLTLDELAATPRATVERLRATAAGQYALRLYAQERVVSQL